MQPQNLIDFLDECIKLFSANSSNHESSVVTDRQALLLKLEEKKRQAEQVKKTKKQAPMPPDFGNSTPDRDNNSFPIAYNNPEGDIKPGASNASYASVKSNVQYEGDQTTESNKTEAQARRESFNEKRRQSLPRQTASETIQRVQSSNAEVQKSNSQNNVKSANQSPVKSRSSSVAEINPRTAYHLLDQVRRNTQLSYEMSKVAVSVVVAGLHEILPQTVSHYLEAILNQLEVPLSVSKMTIEETYDANRLKVIFKELTSCKEDSQQRSWMLYEDESIIVEYIKELTSILVSTLFSKIINSFIIEHVSWKGNYINQDFMR